MQVHRRPAEREAVADRVRSLRRVVWRDFLLAFVRELGDADLSLTQLSALLLLENADQHGLTIKQVAAELNRSLSATSRLLDGLVRQGRVHRSEDQQDRRARRVVLADGGRALIGGLNQSRTDVQFALMDTLPADEREAVIRAMDLLIRAAQRRGDDHVDASPHSDPHA